jgi:hypothetical protein
LVLLCFCLGSAWFCLGFALVLIGSALVLPGYALVLPWVSGCVALWSFASLELSLLVALFLLFLCLSVWFFGRFLLLRSMTEKG